MICTRWRARRSASVSSAPKSVPSMIMLPAILGTRRATAMAAVVFPEPDSPTMPSVLPRATEKLTSSTASNRRRRPSASRPRIGKDTLRLRTSRASCALIPSLLRSQMDASRQHCGRHVQPSQPVAAWRQDTRQPLLCTAVQTGIHHARTG